MIEIKTYSKPKKTVGSGGSSSSTKYISGVISEAEHAGRADKAKRAEVADQANYAGTAASAQNAAYASEAGNLHADAEILQQYLSLKATKDPQVVKGQVKFEQLLQLLQGFSLGNICGFDGSGNGIINSVASERFNSASQQGFGIKPDDNGRYSLSITDLIVWGKAVFNELEIRKLSYAGGNVYLSGAGSKLVKVVPVAYNEDTGGYITSTDEECDGWKCYILADDGTMATQNWWAVGDQARCQTFNIKPGAYNNASNKEYWRCVVAVSSESEFIVNDERESLYGDKKFDWIILSKTNCLTGSDIPAEGDAIVLDGHQVQTGDEGSISRTNVLMLETTGADTPRIVGYRGITDFTHEGKDVFVISPSNVTISSSVFKFKTVSGQTITIINDRGAYDPSVGYYYYDRVSYDNAYWTLIYSGDKQPVKGITPTEEAVNGIVYWRKDLSGGINGDDAVIYTLEASPGYIRLSSDGSIDYTNGYINKGDEYGSDKYLVVRGYKVVKGVRDNRFSTEASPVTLRLTINDGSAYSEYTPSDGDSVSIDFEPKYGSSYYDMLQEISHSGLNSVRVDLCEGSEYNPNKILATCDIPIIQNGKDGQKGDDGASYNINFVTYKDDVHNDTILYVYVVRSVGKESTSTLISKIPEISETTGLEVRVYCDGDYNENLTNHVKWSGSIQRSAWETVKNFEVRLYLDDKLVSSNSYSFGEQGESALEILVTPETLVFDTDDSGLVPSGTSKQASISCYRSGVKVTNVSYSKSAEKNCSASVSESNSSATVTISRITSQEVADTSVNSSTISNTSGYATIQVWDKDTNLYHRVQVKFMVNVAKFTGQMVANNKKFETKFKQISTRFENTPTNEDLTDAESRITQTAREISLSVSEKSVGRRNMLIGSACRKYGDGFVYMSGGYYDGYPLEQIEKNSGIDGVNCIHCRTKQTETNNFYLSGFRWHGISPQGNIKLERGKNYVLSFYAKTHTPNDIYFIAEVLYQGSKIDTSRPAGYAGPTGYSTTFSASEADKWELFTVKVSIPSDTPYEYVEINIFARARIYSFVGGYICKPMLEEGENYNGWTLSEQDYDYVGGNLLDNARTLDRSGTLAIINDTVIQNGYGTDSACIKNLMQANATLSDYKEVLRWIFGSTYLVNGNDYIFSFVAKADVDDARVVCYMWSGDIENSCDIFTEGNGGAWDSRSDGNVVFILSRQWKRYWVHWRPKDGYATPKEVIIRHTGNKSTSASTVYVTQPKLEIGATMTEWTERKTDLVDKASLKEAGILVDAESVTLYGNQVHIKKDKTDANDTVLIDNKTGKVSAGLINADEVVAKGIKTQELEAQNLNVTGNSRLGIFEIHTSTADEDKRDEYTVNGDSIKYSGSYKFPDGKTEASGAGSFLTYKPMFIRQGAPDGYEYMRLGHQFTEWDDCNISGGSKNYFFVGAAARYVCSGDEHSCTRNVLPVALKYNSDIKPAAYVYSVLAKDSAAFAIYTQAVGTAGERLAIQTNGAIRGVEALNVETIYISKQISSGIGAARCINTAEITIRLPINPVVGQKFYVLQEDTGKVNITGDSNHQIILFNKGIVTTCNSNTKGQISVFIWSGNYWFGSFLTGTL